VRGVSAGGKRVRWQARYMLPGVYRFVRPLLFQLPAEVAHGVVQAGLWVWARLFPKARARERLAQTLWGLRFPNPVGLAAGLDKGQVVVPAWFRLGFGFVEVGTITPRPQAGNPRPRLFRLVEGGALVNRMGFNNPGADRVARRLARLPRQPGPIGVNVGRNKETPNDRAAADYVAAFRALAPYGDYAAINVSSPNTPGLRALQAQGELRALVEAVAAARDELRRATGRRVPILVKVSPDESPERLDSIADAALAGGADGFIATNTTTSRPSLEEHPRAREAGGLSGAPLRDLAERACARLYLRVGDRVPIIGVGGISTAEDAYRRIRAGASLVQIYTALVYRGPSAVREIQDGLARLLERDGLTLARAVGADANLNVVRDRPPARTPSGT
jgi:dihydroorotate dehydrogenase